MLLISSPIPSIHITPAPPEECRPDPYSPFLSSTLDIEDDGYRANRLTLPPLAVSSPWHPPLRPANMSHKGLSRDQFDLLLKRSRDQRVSSGLSKVPDLCKLAFENQQLERRARFLSKVNKPSLNVTPHTSKASLDSPMAVLGPLSTREFQSKNSALEIAAENLEGSVTVISPPSPGQDEQMETGLLSATRLLASSKFPPAVLDKSKSRRNSPSLDEITARLRSVHASSKKDRPPSRLPNFVKVLNPSVGSTDGRTKTLSVRSLAPNDQMFDITFTEQVIQPHTDSCDSTSGPKGATVSHAISVIPVPALSTNRADTARDMIVTLGRRTSPPPLGQSHKCIQTST